MDHAAQLVRATESLDPQPRHADGNASRRRGVRAHHIILPLLTVFITQLAAWTPAQAETASIEAAADTYIVGKTPNLNTGGQTRVVLRRDPLSRALVRFDQADILAAIGANQFGSARLEFSVLVSENWDPPGRVSVQRVTADWIEDAATWNCPIDANPDDELMDCSDSWRGGAIARDVTTSVLYDDTTSGRVSFDVTSDVQAFLTGTPNFGWLVKDLDETRDGRVEYASREGNPERRPRLTVEFGTPFPTLTPTPTPEQTRQATAPVQSGGGGGGGGCTIMGQPGGLGLWLLVVLAGIGVRLRRR